MQRFNTAPNNNINVNLVLYTHTHTQVEFFFIIDKNQIRKYFFPVVKRFI